MFTLIAALIAAAAAATAAAHQGAAASHNNARRDAIKQYLLGNGYDVNDDNGWQWAEGLLDPVGTPIRAISQAVEDDNVRNALSKGGLPMAGTDGFTKEDIDYLLGYYDRGDFNLFNPDTWGKRTGIDLDDMRADYDEYLRVMDELGDRPAAPDYSGLAAAANAAVDSENAQINALYDQMLGRSNKVFEDEMAANNAAYNDYVSQIQSNNAMATQAIAGSARFEMDRARRNAIRRGASAAQRLTASVNAQLGLQNRAAQQQLETSNQLASALLQQRQAAAQLRGDYVNNLNADASRRAGLISGTAERKSGLRNSYYNEAESRYDAESEQWKDRMSGYLGDNPFATVYERRQSRGPSRNSTYGM